MCNSISQKHKIAKVTQVLVYSLPQQLISLIVSHFPSWQNWFDNNYHKKTAAHNRLRNLFMYCSSDKASQPYLGCFNFYVKVEVINLVRALSFIQRFMQQLQFCHSMMMSVVVCSFFVTWVNISVGINFTKYYQLSKITFFRR